MTSRVRCPPPHPARPSFAPVELTSVARRVHAAVDPRGVGVSITGMCDDSRDVVPGDLYVALPGSTAHGLDFEQQASRRGAAAVLSDRPASTLPTVTVSDPRRTVGPLASWLYGNPSDSVRVFGVTGTNGKTSTAYLLDAALRQSGESTALVTGICVRSPSGSRTASRTTPEAVPLQRDLERFRREGVHAVSVEVSSHAAAQYRVAGTRFRAMGFTNLGADHLDFHRSMEQYYAAKASLFGGDVTDTAVIDIDDEYGRRLARDVGVPLWTHSTTDPSADLFAFDVRSDYRGSRFTVRSATGTMPVDVSLLGTHQVRNALTALSMAAAGGYDLADAVAGIRGLRDVPGRLERIDVGQPFLALVDYVHNTHGQRALLPFVRGLTTGRVIAVIGATGDRDPGKRFPLGAVAATWCDTVIVTDESPHSENAATLRLQVAAGARSVQGSDVIVEPDRRSALDRAVSMARPGDLVLVAGRGCDPLQMASGVATPFDDRDQLRASLRARW